MIPIVEINRDGYISEKSDMITEMGVIVIENLIPDKTDDEVLKKAETELYSVYVKYKAKLDKNE